MTAVEVQYRDVPDAPGYRVGNDGSVWSFRVGSRWKKLTPTPVTNKNMRREKHLMVVLFINKKQKGKLVHRLVLEAFVGPCPTGLQCRHLDGNPGNNHLANLCWGTPKENCEDKVRHGTLMQGKSVPSAKATEADVAEIRRLAKAGMGTKAIARLFGLSHGTVSVMIRRLTWKHVP